MQDTEGSTSKEFAAIGSNEADGEKQAAPMIQWVSDNRDCDIRSTQQHCCTRKVPL